MQRRVDDVRQGNGSAPITSFASGAGVATFYDDPMSRVLGLDSKTSTWGAWFGFTTGSTLLMVGLMAVTSIVAWMHSMKNQAGDGTAQEIEVVKEEPPPPPPPEPPPEAKPEPAAPVAHPREAPAPPPPPAQAAKVLTREADPNEPVDLTGNTIVQGNADSYAGGFTTAKGTNPTAVSNFVAPAGVPNGAGSRPAAATGGRDLSRAASVGSTDWSRCPFPQEADTAQIDEARVSLQMEIRADGSPAAVRVLRDPGNGFGREARECALRQRYPPALDRDGNPIPATISFIVHFAR